MAKIIVVKGTSATGKGTRVVQFIEWLRTTLNPTELTYTIGDKKRQFGLAFEELKLLFVGQYTVSNKSGLASWTSMDGIHAATSSGDITRELVKQHLEQGYTLVCEGEPLMLSDKWRPQWMFNNYPIDALSILYFNYPDRYQYDARIRGRSGKEAGDSAWSRNESYTKEFSKSKSEILSSGWDVAVDSYSGQDVVYSKEGTKLRSKIAMLPFDAPLWVVGNAIIMQIFSTPALKVLRDAFAPASEIGLSRVFSDYCESHPMTREVGGQDPLAHRVPEKPQKASKTKTKASAQPEAPKAASRSLLDLMKKG
ncbi:putative homing endonuclease [Dickeya phage Coodle]|uniref:Putative homing endonuclease F-LimXI n=2 Tax=Limestonevirus limestone TaxID=1091052 RepID=A0A248H729_9CAUD|nr:putative homing endonuclease F-LimXI [Dickeya phage XF4]AYN55563.1 putative homing endonuclease [Dickeya phage Coodle]